MGGIARSKAIDFANFREILRELFGLGGLQAAYPTAKNKHFAAEGCNKSSVADFRLWKRFLFALGSILEVFWKHFGIRSG